MGANAGGGGGLSPAGRAAVDAFLAILGLALIALPYVLPSLPSAVGDLGGAGVLGYGVRGLVSLSGGP